MSAAEEGPCDDARKESLRLAFISIMRQLDSLLGLCSGGCDYSGVAVACGQQTGRRRKKRAATSVYDITFNIPVNGLAASSSSSLGSPV